jgi:hypothetical protein
MRKTKQNRNMRRRQKGGEIICPPGMPARVCESYKKKHMTRKMNHGLQSNIRAAARWREFRLLPEEERIARQKAHWNNYVAARQSLRTNNNLTNENLENVHNYTEADLPYPNVYE